MSEPASDLVFASLRHRSLAGIVDLAITLAVVAPLTLALQQTGLLLGVAIVIAAFAAAESHGGRTPGKALVHIRVLQLDGQPCTTLAAIVRNVFRVVDGFPGVYLIAIASIGGSKRRQRLGDQAAGTSVYDDRRPGLTAP